MRGEPQMGLDEENIPNDSDPLIQRQIESSQPPEGLDEIKDEEADAGSSACCRICLENESFPGEFISSTKLFSCHIALGAALLRCYFASSCYDFCHTEGFAFSHCTTCKAQFHLRVEFLEDYPWRKIKFRVFVARDVFLVFLAIQTVIATIGGFVYFLDKNGGFRNSFSDSWDRILSKHPVPFYYCIGVLVFFVLLGFFGLILHCSSFDSSDPCMTGCRNCCYGWGILDCFPASMEACFALVVIFVIVFAILGIAYGFLAATMAIQRIWQRHYHILTKRELTKARTLLISQGDGFCFEYVVEDLHGYYTPPKMDPEHEERLRVLKLL
ncbi:unnamed protein product [Musa hybrid cultivar]